MENSTKFSLAIDKINARIAELNIKISKNPTNEYLNKELKLLLEDRDTLYKGTSNEILDLINKYGENK